MRTPIVISCILTSLFSAAQHTNFNAQRNWTLSKKEIFGGGGFTQFQGDLGGINKPGPDYKLRDFSFPSTSWNAVIGYRYRFHPYWVLISRLNVGQLQGNDALKTDPYENSRNLHFRSRYAEFSERIDLIILANEKHSHRPLLIKQRIMHYQFYSFIGLGALLFNPQATYNDEWVDLQPLRTEGQGLDDGPKAYKRITASVPLGLGFRYEISRMWRIGIEAEYKFTFSDYLDDVGGVYYDKDKLATEVNETSAYLSNPSTQNVNWFAAGQQRGDSRLDGFFSISIIFMRNVTYRYCPRKIVPNDSETNHNIYQN